MALFPRVPRSTPVVRLASLAAMAGCVGYFFYLCAICASITAREELLLLLVVRKPGIPFRNMRCISFKSFHHVRAAGALETSRG